jgi:hypothetical protein
MPDSSTPSVALRKSSGNVTSRFCGRDAGKILTALDGMRVLRTLYAAA